jgi:hypothetical protein
VTDLCPPEDLRLRERFTEALRRCSPVFSPVGLEPEAFIARVEQELGGAPVALTSWGPTADDKRLRRTGL